MIPLGNRDRQRSAAEQRVEGGPLLAVVRWAALLVVTAALVFAHGCHGDDVDDELFTNAASWRSAR